MNSLIKKAPTTMTVLEKRQALIQKIQEIPEEWLEKLDNFIDEIHQNKDLSGNDFEKFLQETTLKYKKVWKVLA